MRRKTANDWLEEGLAILAESGAAQLTIDALIARLGVTKGSFYHHFVSYQAYKEALLDYIEAKGTHEIIGRTERAMPPSERITFLLERTILAAPSRLEVAVRAWALQDEQVRAHQERIDRQRLGYLYRLCGDLTSDDAGALTLARMLYTIYIGSQQIMPPIHGDNLRHLYQRCLQAFGLER